MDWIYLIKLMSIIVGMYALTTIFRKVLSMLIRKQSVKMNVDPTNFSFLKNSISFLFFTIALIAIFYITPSLKAFGRALFAGAGVFAAIIGFASQKAFSNIISGIFVLIFRPYRVNDIIEIDENTTGEVEEITLRHTIIRNFENRRIIIPNSIISEETIINSDIIDTKIRKHIEFKISYDSDLELAKKIIREEATKHPQVLDTRTDEDILNGDPLIVIRLIELGDFSVTLRAYIWANDMKKAFAIKCDLYESVKKRFENEGVEIPYPHRTLVYK